MEKQDVLNELYALRAGLSAISQEYDKAQAIDCDCDKQLAKSAEEFCQDLVCYDRRLVNENNKETKRRRLASDNGTNNKNGGVYFHGLEKLQDRYGYIHDIDKKIKDGEIKGDETVKSSGSWEKKKNENRLKGRKAFNRWLADDECDGFFEHVLQIADNEKYDVTYDNDVDKRIKNSKIRFIVFFSLAAVLAVILTVVLAGAFGNWNEGTADIITLIVLAIVFLILLGNGIANVCKFRKESALHGKAITEAEDLCNTARELIRDLPKNKQKTRAILKKKDEKIAPIKESCNDFYTALVKHFNPLLDERDWAHLDLVIFELETRRADNIKEALQLVDRELQTERIQQTIAQATEQICYEIRRGFTQLQTAIVQCTKAICLQLSSISSKLSTIGKQMSELTDAVNLGNALQAKANVTSAQLLSDVHDIRYYQ